MSGSATATTPTDASVRTGASARGSAAEGLHRAEGTDLLGCYEGSGRQEAPYLVRRSDGQVIQLPRLLYLVLEALDGGTADTIAEAVASKFGRPVSTENVTYLVDNKLRPAGLVRDGAPPVLLRADPLLGLRLRVGFVPERVHRALTRGLRPLFRPAVVVVALVALLAIDVQLFLSGISLTDAARQVLARPQLVLLITALTILSAAFHEIGHATAARYGGATPGSMGAGVYVIWPVFFTDVTDSYRLDRRGRLRTDLGGIYFNVLFTVAAAGVLHATGYEPLTIVVLLVQVETLRQFLPFLRLDGYYVVSDLVGVGNLFAYLQPVVVRLTRRGDEDARRRASARLAELKPWARRVVTGWVCLTAPILALNLVLLGVLGPRLAGTTLASLRVLSTQALAALQAGNVLAAGAALLGALLLALPAAGIGWLVVNIGRRAAAGLRRVGARRALPALASTLVLGAALVVLAAVTAPRSFTAAYQDATRAAAPPPPVAVAAVPVAPVADALVASTAAPLDAPSTSTSMAPVPGPTETTLASPVVPLPSERAQASDQPVACRAAVATDDVGEHRPDASGRPTWMAEIACPSAGG